MGWRFGSARPFDPGLNLVSKQWLKAGIILMGANLHWVDAVSAGPRIVVLDMVNMAVVLILLLYVWPFGGLSRRTQILTAVGSGICGASAIAAASPIIAAEEEETGLSLALVTGLGMASMLLLTFLYRSFAFSASVFGLLSGSLLQETGHVVAAAALAGPEALETALLAKLVRVAMLLPVTLVLTRQFRSTAGGPAVPWFILGFAAMSALRSMEWLSPPMIDGITGLSRWLLTAAMAAIGMKMKPNQLRKLRWSHLGQGLVLFAAVLALDALLLWLVL